jgi:hypothetical protein
MVVMVVVVVAVVVAVVVVVVKTIISERYTTCLFFIGLGKCSNPKLRGVSQCQSTFKTLTMSHVSVNYQNCLVEGEIFHATLSSITLIPASV